MSLLSLSSAHALFPPLLRPIHPSFPIAALDLFGAIRLSSVVNWMATGAFDPPSQAQGDTSKPKPRASALQEIFGILVVVFGGETFLALCTGSTPSWLLSPKIVLLFALTHLIQTRTPLISLLPSRPSLALEVALAIPDAIGRTLLLTRFSILPLLHPTPPATGSVLPATPSTLLLTPFILAVPFAAIIFTGTSFFSPSPHLSTPVELRPWGWAAVDSWIPVAVPVLFLDLIGPVNGWPWGLGTQLTEEESIVVCAAFTSAVFLFRAVYNLGPSSGAWARAVGFGSAGGKTKKSKSKSKTA